MAELLPGENRYSLKLNELGEWHVFPTKLKEGKGCISLSDLSICTGMDRSEMVEEVICLDENKMRSLCVTKARLVCGTCVSHLYKTLTEEDVENEEK